MFKIGQRASGLWSISICIVLTFVLFLTSNAQKRDNNKGADLREVKQLPSKEKRWALIVGVSNYKDSNITKLNGAANDAHEIKRALIDYAGFPENQIILLTTDEPEERQPTRENILKSLSNLKGLIPVDGLLLFSFSGHGIESDKQAFLIPSTMSYSDDLDYLKESAVSVDYIKRQIKAIGVNQVLVLLDACRNNPVGSRDDSINPLTQAYKQGFSFDVRNKEVNAFATLYATSVGFRAYEYAEKRQGYFSWALVEGLRGKAANEQGEVTLAGLVNYIEEVVPREVKRTLSSNKDQKPFAMIEGYRSNELVLAISPKKKDEPQLKPSLEIKSVPRLGKFGEATGIVRNVDAANYRIVIYIRVDGQFWIKPYEKSPFTQINNDGTWRANATTHQNDRNGDLVVAFLIRKDQFTADEVVVLGGDIPSELEEKALARVEAERLP